MVIAMRIKLQGFIVFDYYKQYEEARKELSQWLSEGKLQRKETIVKGGLPAAEQALLDLYKGINTGREYPLVYLEVWLISTRQITGGGEGGRWRERNRIQVVSSM